MEEKVVYFEQPGQDNTAAVFDIVDRAMSELVMTGATSENLDEIHPTAMHISRILCKPL